MNNGSSFPQGEGATYGEYSTTTSVNGVKSRFTPSVDAIPSAEAEFGGYQTVTNEIGADSQYNQSRGEMLQSASGETNFGNFTSSTNVGGLNTQFDSSTDILQATSVASSEGATFSEFRSNTKVNGGDSGLTPFGDAKPYIGPTIDTNAFQANAGANGFSLTNQMNGSGNTLENLQTVDTANFTTSSSALGTTTGFGDTNLSSAVKSELSTLKDQMKLTESHLMGAISELRNEIRKSIRFSSTLEPTPTPFGKTELATNSPIIDTAPTFDANAFTTTNTQAFESAQSFDTAALTTNTQTVESTQQFDMKTLTTSTPAVESTPTFDTSAFTATTSTQAVQSTPQFDMNALTTSAPAVESTPSFDTSAFAATTSTQAVQSTQQFDMNTLATSTPAVESTPTFDASAFTATTSTQAVQSAPSFDTSALTTSSPVIDTTPTFDTQGLTTTTTTQQFKTTSTFDANAFQQVHQLLNQLLNLI